MMSTKSLHDGTTFEHAVQESLQSFYRIEHTTLQQATAWAASNDSAYWTTIAEETRRVLSTLSFALAIHGLQWLDPAKGGDAA